MKSNSVGPFKALICINTCNRLPYVKRYIFSFIDFCNKNEQFDFLLALDGNDAEYRTFCDSFEIPLLYSDQREGVGLSKNRVLERFPDYDYYFFLEDDLELQDGRVFYEQIEIANKTGIHHFSLWNIYNGAIKGKYYMDSSKGTELLHVNKGNAQFNFFTAEGLRKVGGWHPMFAEIKRFGHTEHTYRFVNAGLTPAAFNVVPSIAPFLNWYNPPSVTKPQNVKWSENEIYDKEQELMDQKLTFFPVTTISRYAFNGYSMRYNSRVNDYLKSHKDLYPLLTGNERKIALSDYYFALAEKAKGINKMRLFCATFLQNPSNPLLKHTVKRFLKLVP